MLRCVPQHLQLIDMQCSLSTLHIFFHLIYTQQSIKPWWRHQMETFSALLALCVGNSPVTGEFPSQRPVTRSFDVYFALHLNKRLSKQSCGWWFETPWRPLWRHCNGFCPNLGSFLWRFEQLSLRRFFIRCRLQPLSLSRNAIFSRLDFWTASSPRYQDPVSLRPLKLEERWFNYEINPIIHMYTFLTLL